ncbi:MAG: hypothetical protein JNJ98_21310 [Gemmatimonadetes bacterium]|nr:hypothetical protein [Gemmatimonadota bacterium]
MRSRLLCLPFLVAMSVPAQERAFPEGWAGEWRGTLTTVAPPDSVRNRIPLTLTIARDPGRDAWVWRTVFNADTVRGLRDYRLLVRDAARGLYATDEGNGVVLEDTYVGGSLVSVFQVGTQRLESRYTLHADTLTHDIIFWSATPTTTVRGSGANAEGGVEIHTHRILGRQRAVLTRVAAPTPR